MPTAKTAETVK